MKAPNKWIRTIDAIDLMIKSRWDDLEAKRTIADCIAHGALPWKGSWAKFWNPETSAMEEMTNAYNRSLKESPISVLFRAVARNPSGDHSNIPDGELGAYMADWQSGIFRCLNNSFEDEKVNIFFGIYDLKIGVEQFKSFISADVICNYAYVLEFDPSSLYSIYESETKKDSDLPTLIVRRFRVSQSDLRQWWELLGDRKRALSIKFLWESALQAFPDKVVTRRAVEDLAGPRKRGRKETPPE